MPIPSTIETRNVPFMCFQKALNWPLKRSFMASALIDAIEPTNSSYMPIMNAMVPPDTPGMTSAAPMQAPLRVTMRYFLRLFIILFCL